jgi:curli biogenesis system outer membrane secretion channel CsgG
MNIAPLILLTLLQTSGTDATQAPAPADTQPPANSTPVTPPVKPPVEKVPFKLEKDFLSKLPPHLGPKFRIGVQDMEVKVTATMTQQQLPGGGYQQTSSVSVPPPTDFGQGLAEMMTSALTETNRFVVLERSNTGLQDIGKEQQMGGVTDVSRAQQNQMLGAQYLIRGAVTEFSYSGSGTNMAGGVAGFLPSFGDNTATVTIDVRIYDSSTGEVIASKYATGKAKSRAFSFSFVNDKYSFANQSFQSSPLGRAVRESISKAIYQICVDLDKQTWEGKVSNVENENGQVVIYTNTGKTSGVKEGDQFEIFHPGHPIPDPDNPGRNLGFTHGQLVGHLKLTQIMEKFAVASLVDGDGVAPGDIIRVPGSYK